MKRGRLPLTALRSFEAAGRLQSFTAAAEELFVSQAAISRQVRELEALIGQPLFDRLHRAVALTDEGERLLAVLTAGFDSFDAALTRIGRLVSSSSLTISSEPTFAALWLVPQLAAFRGLHPDVDVTVESDPRLVEFRTSEAELAIRHSDVVNRWPRTQSVRLAGVEMTPMIAPSLMATGPAIEEPPDLLAYSLLHEESRRVWGRWFALSATDSRDPDRGPVFADGALVMQAVLRGHGVGLCDRQFAAEEIAAGSLVAPFDLALPHGAYYLVARDFSKLSPGARIFADWIQTQFEGR
ncbi:LysR family transcriptional regulator [Rhizobium sp. KVB221]|uniref:HTH-type transcriptional regulator TtuA n=1 Tax=Rhizobium setariae TaxID=2801340 RepID=A0A936YJT6_9HYPH|nr:LysR substrate-binding domain-containing protein [Rhizobium setariae]MBL0371503.1 LysR family transcriptional regulator [Rhizobium setariae]